MNFSKSNTYDLNFVKTHLMGPNSMKLLEELTNSLTLHEGMRVLDLGCGQGLTSIFLAKEYGVTVFATDLWISATDNLTRFRQMGFESKIIPIHAEAHELPFADEYFDVAISVDAYHYFGIDEFYLSKHLAPLVKRDGQIAIAVPGLQNEFISGVPEELKPYWTDDMNFHTHQWWNDLWEKSGAVQIKEHKEMECFNEAWDDWLSCDNDFARHDIDMLKADNGNYFNLVSITATKK